LKFALFTKKVTDDDLTPSPVKRDLNIIFEKHTQYTKENTLLISNFKNEMSEFRNNEIIIPMYDPVAGYTSFQADAHLYYLMEYLIILYGMSEINKSNI
jgi:hypothetical protein